MMVGGNLLHNDKNYGEKITTTKDWEKVNNDFIKKEYKLKPFSVDPKKILTA